MGRMNLEEFCLRFHAFLDEKPSFPMLIEAGQELFGELLSDPGWFRGILRKLILDRDFLKMQEVSVFHNEITLHRSSDRAFSVLAYIWEPQTPSPIHDHGSWGMIGGLIHQVQERKYRRLDEGQVEGHAELEEISSEVIGPGRTTYVFPLDKGIHRMEAAMDQLAVTVSVYGRPIRQGYVQFFDPSQKKVVQAYPPKLFKEVLAIRTLGSIPEPWAEDILTAETPAAIPDYLMKEYQLSLSKLRRGKPKE
jgi:predicted metal-dependent enzyme (double-stranded beta helix superfamily)